MCPRLSTIVAARAEFIFVFLAFHAHSSLRGRDPGAAGLLFREHVRARARCDHNVPLAWATRADCTSLSHVIHPACLERSVLICVLRPSLALCIARPATRLPRGCPMVAVCFTLCSNPTARAQCHHCRSLVPDVAAQLASIFLAWARVFLSVCDASFAGQTHRRRSNGSTAFKGFRAVLFVS